MEATERACHLQHELHVDSAWILRDSENELVSVCPDLNSTVMTWQDAWPPSVPTHNFATRGTTKAQGEILLNVLLLAVHFFTQF